MATQRGPKIVRGGLLLYYEAADKKAYSGSTWFDLTGNNNHGSLVNSPTFTSSAGGGFTFNGSNTYVNMGTVGSNNLNLYEVTYIVWLNMSYFLGGAPFLGIFNGGSGSNEVPVLQMNNGGGVQKLQFQVKNFNGSSFTLAGTNSINYNTNVMVSVTFSVNTGVATSYINNTQDTQVYFFQGSTMQNVYGQSYRLGYGSPGNSYWLGTIYSAQIYNRALTAAEITQNFNAKRGRFGL